jgi:pyrroloquinoline quinone biosynthesis protein B
LPQWNCGCANCSAARSGRIAKRTQSSFAVSGDGSTWWLVNVSPDVAQQIEAYEPLQPRGVRGTPIAGMLLTDANVDHIGGLAVLRQSGGDGFAVWSTDVVRAIAIAQPAFAPFAEQPHRWNAFEGRVEYALDERLVMSAVALAGTTPGYAGRERLAGAVVGIAIADRVTGGRLLAAPVFGAVDDALLAAVDAADAALIDGSFFADDELAEAGIPGKAARRLGHLPVGGGDGSLATLAPFARTTRLIYAHLNNTNPLVDPRSVEANEARARGFEIAEDAMTFTL